MRFVSFLIAVFVYIAAPSMCALGIYAHECLGCANQSADCGHEGTCIDDPCNSPKSGAVRAADQQIAESAALIPVLPVSVLLEQTAYSFSPPRSELSRLELHSLSRPHAAFPANAFPLLI
ncbi:MAG: hypothetical protein U0136_09370 [Bdellovibrionota bacterium]